ncbi:MAG: DUF4234 domain-containing protein [Thermoleophilia bacterium]
MSTDIPPPPPPPHLQPPTGPSVGVVGTPKSVGKVILLSIITLGIYTYVWTWRTHEEYKRYSGEGVGGWLGVVIYFLLSPVTMFLIANETQKLYERENELPPVRTILGLWFLLPLIGNIIWYVKVQNAVNAFWVRRGAQPA